MGEPDYPEILRLIRKYRHFQDKTLTDIFIRVGHELEEKMIDIEQCEAKADTRTCSCYPGEGPIPCPKKHALRHCWRAAVLEETQQGIVELKNRDRQPHEQALLDYMMRVRNVLEI